MTSIWVNYYDDDRYFQSIQCEKSDTIGSFLCKTLNKNKEEKEEENSLSVCLKGRIISNEDKLEKYIDDLHYYAFFISKDPTKEIQIQQTPTNLNDYQAKKPHVTDPHFSFEAINKKTNKKVLIFFSSEPRYDYHIARSVYINHLFNSPSIPRYIGHYFSVDNDTLQKFSSKLSGSKSFYIIDGDFCEYDNSLSYQYLNSKGSDTTKMNPTKRSKLIFGFASLMKKLHQKGIGFDTMDCDVIQLDENYEPYIANFSKAVFPTSKIPTFNITRLIEEAFLPYLLYAPPELITDNDLLPEFSLEALNVYSFAFLIYQMFNPKNGIILNNPKHKKPVKSLYIFLTSIVDGYRPIRLENIPDHYWELLEVCWQSNPDYRPSFKEIVEALKDDKFALTEFGVKTNLDELHEYQNRIENAVVNYVYYDDHLSNESLIREIEELKNKIKKMEKQKQQKKETTDISMLNILDSEMIHNLRTIREISSGGSGKVLEVGKEETFALKVMHTGDHSIEDFKEFIEEYEKLIRLKHPNIVKAHGIFLSDEKTPPSILLELCSNDLKTMIVKKIYKSKSDIVKWIYQIVEGMKFVHKNGIVHRDLKPSNILIGKDGKIRISDFGIAKLMTIEEQSTTRGVGTQKFMAPEILKEEKYNEKADVYSFGVLLYFILSGGEMPKINIIQIGNGVKAKIPDSFTKFSKELINDCWNYKSKDRPSFEDILSRLEKQNFKVFEMDKSEINDVLLFVKEHKKLIPEY